MNYTIRNLLIATALMVLGIVLATAFLNKERKDLSRGKQEITVYVAKKDIPPGTPASQLEEGGYLDTKEIVREDAPPSPITDLRDLTKPKLTSNDTVYKDDVLTLRAFDKAAGLSPTASIKGNQRLAAFAFPPSNTVGNLVRPGDRVDIVASRQVNAEGGQAIVTWFVARDVYIVETPESMKPSSGDEKPEAEAPDPEGDRQMFVLRLTDAQFADMWAAQATSDDYMLQMLLRPAAGDTETPTNPLFDPIYYDDTELESPQVKGKPAQVQVSPSSSQL